MLGANGYQRTDAVADAGEYAVRGSLIDLFPASEPTAPEDETVAGAAAAVPPSRGAKPPAAAGREPPDVGAPGVEGAPTFMPKPQPH